MHYLVVGQIREAVLHCLREMHETLDGDVLVRAAVLALLRLVSDEDIVRPYEVWAIEPREGVLRDLLEEDYHRVTAIDCEWLDADMDGPRGHGGLGIVEDCFEDLARWTSVEVVDLCADVGLQVSLDVLQLGVRVIEDLVVANLFGGPVRALGVPEWSEF